MPTTFAFLFRVAVLAAFGAGAVYALATFVEPSPQSVSIRIAPERFQVSE